MRLKIFALFLMLSSFGIATAQDSHPLVIHINGQLYRWSIGDAEPTFTGCDLNGNVLRTWDHSLTQSSDGLWAALMVLPEDRLDSAPSPTGNLWVCHLQTGEAYALSDSRPEYPNSVSEGAFSPDGSRIIWAEIDENDIPNPLTAAVFLHDFSTKETRVLIDAIPLTEYCGIGTGAPQVIWGTPGIAVGYFRFDPDNPCSSTEEIGFSHYADDGSLLNSFPVENTYFSAFEWLDGPIIAYLGNQAGSREPQLYTVNMTTGEVRAEESALEAFIPGENTGTYLTANAAPQMKLPSSDTVLEAPNDVALSPDGTLIAAVLGRTLYFGENGRLRPASWNLEYFPISDENEGLTIPDNRTGQFEIAWANPSYRLVPIPQTVCPSVEPLDLEGGGHVIEGLGSNIVRSAPDPNAEMIAALAEGDYVPVIDAYTWNPFRGATEEVCSAGIRWREILLNGQIGWTAESQGDTYYLQE